MQPYLTSEERTVVLNVIEHVVYCLASDALFLERLEPFNSLLLLIELQVAVCKVDVETVIFGVVAYEFGETVDCFFILAFTFADKRKTKCRIDIKVDVHCLVIIFSRSLVVTGVSVCISCAGKNNFIARIHVENFIPIFYGTELLVHAAVAVCEAEQRVEVFWIHLKRLFKESDTFVKCLELSVAVADRSKHADVNALRID